MAYKCSVALARAAISLLSLAAIPGLHAEENAFAELVDFDVAIGFSSPLQVTILRSYDRTKNLFYVLPETVELVLPVSGNGSIGLQVAQRTGGSLTFSVVPRASQIDFQKAIVELKKRFPTAVFAYPLPSKASVQLITMTSGTALTKDGESSTLTSQHTFTVKLSPVEARMLLLPDATTSPSATFRVSYTLKGVSRNSEGKPLVEERVLGFAGVLNGFCAPYPTSTISVATGNTGCAKVRFDKTLVLEVQRLLKLTKDYVGKVDGVFGTLTDEGIRSFQRRQGLYVTGYPTRELLEVIREKQRTT